MAQGKLDGSVLADFPDVDLAEALCLLLDLETAAPEVLTTALDRLGLPPARRRALGPILEERLQRGGSSSPRSDAYGHDHAIEHHARKLIALSGSQGRSFAESYWANAAQEFAMQALRWLDWRAFTKLGTAIAARRPMMATTIMISTSVKPPWRAVLLFIMLSFCCCGVNRATELRYTDRRRVHNLKYYAWVEQQGRTYEEIQKQWYEPTYWTDVQKQTGEIDELIVEFNKEVGLS